MESPHCLEGRPDLGLTQDICLPSRELIVRQIKSLSKRSGGIQRVFVASDIRDPKIDDFREKLGRGVSFVLDHLDHKSIMRTCIL